MNLKPGWVDAYTREIRAAGTYSQRVRRARPELDAQRPKFRDKPPPALWGLGGGAPNRESRRRGVQRGASASHLASVFAADAQEDD